ncbi:restriction modification system DNA specificity domain-containing protein [Pseudodesulfovibrio mercurii]|jgi:type I restriction enzyme S subunit|uniref:Restriction modification system DNA specificity domain-containing protein n=1 Tax=Pseudodesulfovibrio mercurii TaxID=641491 RepID=F0JIA3_9BACT|nr:restriction endonuclease subunit S [Pseudodesulfovibrio mercurii]EGB15414.1 restriction modification system DNA specificity domain-containing protein [Pseudodesulfovibrio mercurii]
MIPEGWQKAKGVEIADKITKGASPKWQGFEYQENGILFVTSENVRDGFLDISRPKFLPDEFGEKMKNSRLADGDILINIVGASIGRSCIYENNGVPANINQAVCLLRLKKGYNVRFFSLYLQLPSTVRMLLGIQSDSARPNLSLADIRNCLFVFPKEQEQKAIATILSTWDRAIEKAEALIKAKERRKTGLMQRLLTGKVRFGEFAGEAWKEVPLGTLFEPVADTVGDKDIPPYSISAGIGFVSQREKWGKDIAGRQYANYTHLRKGEFAYNKGNSKKYQCGCAYLLRDQDEISVPNVFISFRPKSDQVSADFYEHFFIADYHARELKRYITSGARSDGLLNLNKKDFFKINVPCPPPREQEAIAKVLNAAVAEIDEHRNQLAALKEQKKGLMQQLLTGKVRVKS